MKRVTSRERTKPIIKSCGCGLTYNASQWRRLPLVSRSSDDVERVELRNCRRCHSTLYLGTPRATIFYRVERAPGGFLIFRRAGVDEVMVRDGDVGALHVTQKAVQATISRERRIDRDAGKRLAVDVFITKGAK